MIDLFQDVGRYPAYKEIYAEYTWTGTSVSDDSKFTLCGLLSGGSEANGCLSLLHHLISRLAIAM